MLLNGVLGSPEMRSTVRALLLGEESLRWLADNPKPGEDDAVRDRGDEGNILNVAEESARSVS
jgi:hypothetical protein